MSKELIERVRLFIGEGIGNEIVSRIEELEKERDQLRDQVKILRETLDGIRIANWREWDDGVRSADHFVDWAKSRAEYTLAATDDHHE